MVLQLWETLKEAIVAYTGLSPTAFFTIVALAVAVYYAVSGLFVSTESSHQSRRVPEEEMEPLPPPVQLGEVTEEELRAYDGSNPKKPLLMAIKGQIYDVSQSRMFYGPGGPYALFAGKDASRALAKMSFEEKDLTGDVSGLGPFELEALQDWEYKFMSKYVKVGTIKKEVPVSDASASEPAVEASDRDITKTSSNNEEHIEASDPDVAKPSSTAGGSEVSDHNVAKASSTTGGPGEASDHNVAKPRSILEEGSAADHDVAKPTENGSLDTAAAGTAETHKRSSTDGEEA